MDGIQEIESMYFDMQNRTEYQTGLFFRLKDGSVVAQYTTDPIVPYKGIPLSRVSAE